jgi:probable phosphoglycerate mutase
MSHFLYLVRHGEVRDAEFGITDGPLSERGRQQAHALGKRLADVPFDQAFTSPLDRALETASILGNYVQGPPVEQTNLLFDCIPSSSKDAPDSYDAFFSGVDEEDIEAGQAQMQDAVSTFMTRPREDVHTLLVTHNFVIGYLVAHALGMPEWRWLTLGSGNTALTVLRLRSTRPSELTLFGSTAHLPREMRTGMTWTPAI